MKKISASLRRRVVPLSLPEFSGPAGSTVTAFPSALRENRTRRNSWSARRKGRRPVATSLGPWFCLELAAIQPNCRAVFVNQRAVVNARRKRVEYPQPCVSLHQFPIGRGRRHRGIRPASPSRSKRARRARHDAAGFCWPHGAAMDCEGQREAAAPFMSATRHRCPQKQRPGMEPEHSGGVVQEGRQLRAGSRHLSAVWVDGVDAPRDGGGLS